MQSKVFFRAASGRDYELTVLHDDEQYVPRFLSEDGDGCVVDLGTDMNWDSLASMTHDLEVEIIGCDSDLGN